MNYDQYKTASPYDQEDDQSELEQQLSSIRKNIRYCKSHIDSATKRGATAIAEKFLAQLNGWKSKRAQLIKESH